MHPAQARELTGQYALLTQPLQVAAKAAAAAPGQPAPKAKPVEDKERPGTLTVDKSQHTVTVECAVAPRQDRRLTIACQSCQPTVGPHIYYYEEILATLT
jgi:hypothetical protein